MTKLEATERASILAGLIDAYTVDIESLVERYPAQDCERAMARLEGVEIVQLKRAVVTKFGQAFAKNELALCFRDEQPHLHQRLLGLGGGRWHVDKGSGRDDGAERGQTGVEVEHLLCDACGVAVMPEQDEIEGVALLAAQLHQISSTVLWRQHLPQHSRNHRAAHHPQNIHTFRAVPRPPGSSGAVSW